MYGRGPANGYGYIVAGRNDWRLPLHAGLFFANTNLRDTYARARRAARIRIGLAVATANRAIVARAHLRFWFANARRIRDVDALARLHLAKIALSIAEKASNATAHAASFTDLRLIAVRLRRRTGCEHDARQQNRNHR